jgi:hypothetical protein
VRINSVNPGVIVTDVHRKSGMSEQQYVEVKWNQSEKITRNVAQPIFCQSECILKKAAGSKRSLDGRKFAQSGHPEWSRSVT